MLAMFNAGAKGVDQGMDNESDTGTKSTTNVDLRSASCPVKYDGACDRISGTVNGIMMSFDFNRGAFMGIMATEVAKDASDVVVFADSFPPSATSLKLPEWMGHTGCMSLDCRLFRLLWWKR